MQRLFWTFAFVVAAALVSSEAHALAPRLLDHGLRLGGLSASADVGTPALGKARLIDDGGGAAGTGDLVFQGCASLVTGVVASFAVGLVLAVAIVGAVGFAGNDGTVSKSEANAIFTATLVGAIIGSLAIPLATSGIVSWLARKDGANPNFWTVYLYSMVTRVVFGALSLVSSSLGYVGSLAGAVAEVYAANYANQGSTGAGAPLAALREGGAVVGRVRKTFAAEAERQQQTAFAPNSTVFALSF